MARLAAALSYPQPMRRGSLYERRMKCGQAACACQHDPKAAHGPYFTLTQKFEGKTRSRYLTAQQVPVVRGQIEAGQRFRQHLEGYWEVCERWADEQLGALPASAEEAEKRGFRRRSTRKSSRKSGPELVCPCGRQAQYRGRHEKTFASVLGLLRLEQAYYRCDHCHSGFCPRDRALRLESFSLTPGVLRRTASAAALVSFAESSGLLRELAGVEIGANAITALRCAKLSGRFEDFWERHSDRKLAA